MTFIAQRLSWDLDVRTPFGVAPLLSQLRASIRCLLCALFGHDMLRHFEPDRLSLRCPRCGTQTRGWTIDVNPAFRRRTRANATTSTSINAAATVPALITEDKSSRCAATPVREPRAVPKSTCTGESRNQVVLKVSSHPRRTGVRPIREGFGVDLRAHFVHLYNNERTRICLLDRSPSSSRTAPTA